MNTYSHYVKSIYDGLEGRESIEWANFWYSSSNCPPRDRILMIGDSTARMVRSSFERLIGIPVDMIGTSCGLHDVLFANQIDAFFASTLYHYSVIFVQLGHHSIRGEKGDKYNEEDYKRFGEDLEALVEYLQQYSKKIILLTSFLNVMPLPSHFNSRLKSLPILLYRKVFGEKIDYSWSDVVVKKNQITKEIANLHHLSFIDIDYIMRSQCSGIFPKYIHIDHIHYEPRAKSAIVKEYAKFL